MIDRSALAWLLGIAAIGCGSAQSPLQRPAAALPQCVLHAGQINVETTRQGGPDGRQIGPTARKSSCAYNAECIKQKRVSSPGDGHVSLQCEGQACVCRIEFLAPRQTTHELSFEATCETAEQAEQLLVDRCIPARSRYVSSR